MNNGPHPSEVIVAYQLLNNVLLAVVELSAVFRRPEQWQDQNADNDQLDENYKHLGAKLWPAFTNVSNTFDYKCQQAHLVPL